MSVLSLVLSVSFSVGFSHYLQIFFHLSAYLPCFFCPPLIPWNGGKLGFGCQSGVASSWWRWFLGCQARLWSWRGTGASVCPTLLVFRDEKPGDMLPPLSFAPQKCGRAKLPYSLVTSCLMTAPLLACGTRSAGANELCHPEEMWLSLSSLFPVRCQCSPRLLASSPHPCQSHLHFLMCFEFSHWDTA